MAKFRLSNVAKDDLVRIHQHGTHRFGALQADKYFNELFDCFESIAKHPYAFEAVDYIKPGYRRCICGIESVFYRINDQTVEIMAVIGRQNINLILK